MTNDVHLIRMGDRYHLRIKGDLYKFLNWGEVQSLCVYAGYDPWTVLASAINLSDDPLDIEYKPVGRHKWWVNGKPHSVKIVRAMLRDTGCSSGVIDTILHGERLHYQIQEYLKQIKTPAA